MVRTSYYYYPQPKDLQDISGISYQLPTLAYTSVTFVGPNPGDPPQGSKTEPVPLKISAMDPTKVMSVDDMPTWNEIQHKKGSRPGGMNGLFPDAHVSFATVAANSSRNQVFDRNFWDPAVPNGPGKGAIAFRSIMYFFQP
jgi:hypothetical protein